MPSGIGSIETSSLYSSVWSAEPQPNGPKITGNESNHPKNVAPKNGGEDSLKLPVRLGPRFDENK